MNHDLEEILELDGFNAYYQKLKAVNNVSLTVRAGDVVGIIGSNGHGKSSLLKAIMGLIKTDGGIKFNREDIHNIEPFERVKRGLVLVPEREGFFPRFTVKQNLYLACSSKQAKEDMNENMKFVCDIFPVMAERISQRAGTLSGGERKMLAVSMGVMSAGKMLMIDEPSLGLAPLLASTLYNGLAEIKERVPALLVVEQNVTLLKALAKTLCLIENGTFVLKGCVQDVLSHGDVEKAYLGVERKED